MSLSFGSLHPHHNIHNPFLPTVFFFPQQPLDMPLELIYSMASATSHVNPFHMFILLRVKRGSASSFIPVAFYFQVVAPAAQPFT